MNAASATGSGSACSGRNGALSRCSGSTRVTATSICSSGFAVVTAQSLPIASVAPAAEQVAERVLQLGPLAARGTGSVSSSICGSVCAQYAWQFADHAERGGTAARPPAARPGGARCGAGGRVRPVRGARRLRRRPARCARPGRRSRAGAPGSRAGRARSRPRRAARGSTYVSPWLSVVPAAAVAVGLEQRAGVVLQHPVDHDLHRRRVEAGRPARLPLREEVGDLLQPAVPVPPERADHARGEPAVGRRASGRPRACPA